MPSKKGSSPSKTTSKHFELFKKHFNAHIEKLGLFGWRYYFSHKNINNYAQSEYDLEGRIAHIIFCVNWCCNSNDKERCSRELNEESIKEIAKHEAHHMILARLNLYAIQRFVNRIQIDEAEEEIVRILDRFL